MKVQHLPLRRENEQVRRIDDALRNIERNLVKVLPTTEVTASYTVTQEDTYIMADPTSASITITLPAGFDQRFYCIKNIAQSAANTVTISPSGSDTVDGGSASIVLANQESVFLLYIASKADWGIL